MSNNQFSRLYIMAVIAVPILTVTATISVTPASIAQNMTEGGNMTGGNMSGQISSTQEEVEAQCSLSPACIT